MGRSVAVTGATGFIGSAVARRLVADGRHVRALVEPGLPASPNLDALPPGSIERVEVDVTDHARMAEALAGCETLYHLAALYRVWVPDPEIIHRVNVEGTVATLLAAQKAGVGKVVYTSSIAAVGLREGREPSDETVPFDLFDVANDYILTKWTSERVALRFAEAGLPVVVVNPAFPFGPGDVAPTPTGKILLQLVRGELPAIPEGGLCAVDVDDVAAGHVAAEHRGRIGERYILGNHNLTFAELVDVVCAVAKVPRPRLRVPGGVARAFAVGAELWSRRVSHREPQTTYRSVAYALRYPFFDTTKAREELGLPCTPIEESVRRAIEWWRAHGML